MFKEMCEKDRKSRNPSRGVRRIFHSVTVQELTVQILYIREVRQHMHWLVRHSRPDHVALVSRLWSHAGIGPQTADAMIHVTRFLCNYPNCSCLQIYRIVVSERLGFHVAFDVGPASELILGKLAGCAHEGFAITGRANHGQP
jgi:hypothetical protein